MQIKSETELIFQEPSLFFWVFVSPWIPTIQFDTLLHPFGVVEPLQTVLAVATAHSCVGLTYRTLLGSIYASMNKWSLLSIDLLDIGIENSSEAVYRQSSAASRVKA